MVSIFESCPSFLLLFLLPKEEEDLENVEQCSTTNGERPFASPPEKRRSERQSSAYSFYCNDFTSLLLPQRLEARHDDECFAPNEKKKKKKKKKKTASDSPSRVVGFTTHAREKEQMGCERRRRSRRRHDFVDLSSPFREGAARETFFLEAQED